jgi:hypothetical protein
MSDIRSIPGLAMSDPLARALPVKEVERKLQAQVLNQQ